MLGLWSLGSSPIGLSLHIAFKATLEDAYPGAPHGLTLTHKDQFNADLLEFIKR
jgi:non-heme chloroperoxidase